VGHPVIGSLRKWPAIDVRSGPADLISAIVDDFSPTAIEERAGAIRVFFAESHLRDAAGAALSDANYNVQPVEVDDENWARRSQENLQPVTVGRITVAPPAEDVAQVPGPAASPAQAALQSSTIVIRASMGFGTGHHATTRLCLRALQAVDIANRDVLDVGTGSGVLAIAAVCLGAARAVGIDYDPDAIQAANENLALNPGVKTVEFRVADLLTGGLPSTDVVTANLTGAFLVRRAGLLQDLVRPGGTLIVSGLLEDERDDVLRAFTHAGSKRSLPGSEAATRPTSGAAARDVPDLQSVWEHHEDGWVALAMTRS